MAGASTSNPSHVDAEVQIQAFVNSIITHRAKIYARLIKLEASLSQPPGAVDVCDVRRQLPLSISAVVLDAIPHDLLVLAAQNAPKVRNLAQTFGITEKRLLFDIAYDRAKQGHNFFRALAKLADLTSDWDGTLDILCRFATERRQRPTRGRPRPAVTFNDAETAERYLESQKSPSNANHSASHQGSSTDNEAPQGEEHQRDVAGAPATPGSESRNQSASRQDSPVRGQATQSQDQRDLPGSSTTSSAAEKGFTTSEAQRDPAGSSTTPQSQPRSRPATPENGRTAVASTNTETPPPVDRSSPRTGRSPLFADSWGAEHVSENDDYDPFADGWQSQAAKVRNGKRVAAASPKSAGNSRTEQDPVEGYEGPDYNTYEDDCVLGWNSEDVADVANCDPDSTDSTTAKTFETKSSSGASCSVEHRPKRLCVTNLQDTMAQMVGQGVDALRTEGQKVEPEIFDLVVGRLTESQGPSFNYVSTRDVEAMIRDDYEPKEHIASGVIQAKLTFLPITTSRDRWAVCVVEQDVRKATGAYILDPSAAYENLHVAQIFVDAYVRNYLPESQPRNYAAVTAATSRQNMVGDSGVHAAMAVLSILAQRPVCGSIDVALVRHLMAAFCGARLTFKVPHEEDPSSSAADMDRFNRENPGITNTGQLLERLQAWRSEQAARRQKDLRETHTTIVSCCNIVQALCHASAGHLLDLRRRLDQEAYLHQFKLFRHGEIHSAALERISDTRDHLLDILNDLEELWAQVEACCAAAKKAGITDT